MVSRYTASAGSSKKDRGREHGRPWHLSRTSEAAEGGEGREGGAVWLKGSAAPSSVREGKGGRQREREEERVKKGLSPCPSISTRVAGLQSSDGCLALDEEEDENNRTAE